MSALCSALRKTCDAGLLTTSELFSLLSAVALAAAQLQHSTRLELDRTVTQLLSAESRRREHDTVATCILAKRGPLQLVLAAMEACGEEKHVLENGAACVANLAASSGECKAAIVGQGGVRVLLGCVRDATSAVCAQGCRALGNLCFGWGAQVEAAKASVLAEGGCDLVVGAIKKHRDSASVLRWGAHAIRNLSVQNPRIQQALLVADGLPALLDGQRCHSEGERVVETVFAALALLGKRDAACCSHHLQQQLPKDGFCLYAHVMTRHLRVPLVQHYACLAIAYACAAHAANAGLAVEAKLLDSVEEALLAHPTELEIQRWGCAALCAMLSGARQGDCAVAEGRLRRLADVVQTSANLHAAANGKTRTAVTTCLRQVMSLLNDQARPP